MNVNNNKIIQNLPAYHNLSALQKWVNHNTQSRDATLAKKCVFYQAAIDAFRGQSLQSTYSVKQLTNLGDFLLKPSHKPGYFNNNFNHRHSHIKIDNNPGFFDYNVPAGTENAAHYWVDFAAEHFGGGAFTHGFVQEEQMLACIPEMANHAVNTFGQDHKHSNLRTRYGRDHQNHLVQEGSPSPVVFKGVAKVLDIHGVYGREISNVAKSDLIKHYNSIKGRYVNILAIAAPNLPDRNFGTDLATVEDLFNTAIAGFATAKSATNDQTKRVMIHTGKFGCGAFNNNARVAYILQRLAADHMDIDLVMYDYKTADIIEVDQDYQAVMQAFNRPGNPDKSVRRLLEITSQVMKQRIQTPSTTSAVYSSSSATQAALL